MLQKLSNSPGCCIGSLGFLGTAMSNSSSILHCDYWRIFILSEVVSKIRSFFKCVQSIAVKTILEQGIVQVLIPLPPLPTFLLMTLLGQKSGGIHFPYFDLPTMSGYSSKGIHWKQRGYGVRSVHQMSQEKVFESDTMWVMPTCQLLYVT